MSYTTANDYFMPFRCRKKENFVCILVYLLFTFMFLIIANPSGNELLGVDCLGTIVCWHIWGKQLKFCLGCAMRNVLQFPIQKENPDN